MGKRDMNNGGVRGRTAAAGRPEGQPGCGTQESHSACDLCSLHLQLTFL